MELLDLNNAVNDEGDIVPRDDVFVDIPNDFAKEEINEQWADIEAYYDVLLEVLSEAARYVKANGKRKADGQEVDETPAMKNARERFETKVKKLNRIVTTMPRTADGHKAVIYRPTVFLEKYVGNVERYEHVLVSGKNKGSTEMRTISSCRIKSYRNMIKRYRKEEEFVSARELEKEFWESEDSVELREN